MKIRNLFTYEIRNQRVAERGAFQRRLLKHLGAGFVIVLIALAMGMAGSIYFGRMNGFDAFLFSAMILSGMGPVGDIQPNSMKIFAGLYAIICGLLLFAVAGLAFLPILHRILHVFHADDKDWQK